MSHIDCTPITISDCPPTGGCDACKEIVKTDCIKYYGPDLDCIEVESGDTLSEILANIDEKVCTASGGLPQACLKLKIAGSEYSEINPVGYRREFDSCSQETLPAGCTRTYTMFNNWGEELWTGSSLVDAKAYAVSPGNLYLGLGYTIVEYITCPGGSTESLDVCFEVRGIDGVAGRVLKDSCKCCQDVQMTYWGGTLQPMTCGQCITLDFEPFIEHTGNVIPYSLQINNETNCTVTYTSGLQAEVCVPEGFVGTATFGYRVVDIYGKVLSASFRQISIPVECADIIT